jgi:16S rRNA processing protein RimM
MTPGPFTALARVVKTHGLRGEVAVEPATDLPFVLPVDLQVWFVPPPSTARTGVVESVRRGPKGPLIKISGVDEIGVAKTLVGCDLMARASDLPDGWDAQPDAELDPVGLLVSDVRRGYLGEVTECIITGANDVWVIDGPLGEVLIPVIDECVVSVDWSGRTAQIQAMPGLLPEETGS